MNSLFVLVKMAYPAVYPIKIEVTIRIFAMHFDKRRLLSHNLDTKGYKLWDATYVLKNVCKGPINKITVLVLNKILYFYIAFKNKNLHNIGQTIFQEKVL